MKKKKKFLLSIFAFTAIMWNTLHAEDYALNIKGIQVTSTNAHNILGDNKVIYDNDTRTLTLNNAEITAANGVAGIQNTGIADLNIVLKGKSTIISNGAAGILLNQSTAFKGGGSVTVISDNDICILLQDNNTALKVMEGCKLDLKGKNGISGIKRTNSAFQEMLEVNNSTIKATGTEGSIVNLKSFVRSGSSIIKPEGAFFNPTLGSIIWAGNGEIVKTQVIIDVSYEIQLGQTWVTLDNQNDILGDGKANYNPTTKTLTLNGATINAPQKTHGILNRTNSDLVIHLEGANTILSDDYSALSLRANTTITGSGSLKVNSNKGVGVYIDVNTTLTIKDCNVEVVGSYGFSGDEGKEGETLKVINSTLKATGEKSGSIVDINKLILENCSISQPIGASFNENKHCVEKDGVLLKTQIIIEPSTSSNTHTNKSRSSVEVYGVNGILFINILEPIQEKEAIIYSMSGRAVNKISVIDKQNIISIPPGIYIVKIGDNTQKAIVK
ncbi:MAG: T9SS type A sorting domain-containing protein [Porphyromonadaceae bacterium]|nr:T9SS type A sorting domain-containing protein [Porphyromonadaceae bacterium]